jgi:FtsH-binding integral membrane protein
MMQNPYDARTYDGTTGVRTTVAHTGLLSKVAGLLAFAMAFTGVGALVGAQAPGLGLPAMIGVLIMAIGLGFAKNVAGLNLVMLYTLTSLMGIALGGIIAVYIGMGMGGIVVQAAATTSVLTVGLSMYALVTRRDFSGLGSKLFLLLLGLIAASVVGIFVQAAILHIIIGLAGAVIFSFYLIYHVQQAKFAEDTLPNAIMVTVGIYLAIINIFLSLLRLFGILGGDD